MNLNNLSTVTMFVGLPGCGKTTLAAHLTKAALKYKKKHRTFRVFSNVPIKGALDFDWKIDFGNFDMSYSLILLDESGLEVDNRSWDKNFTRDKVEFLKLLRHYKSKLICFSQTWQDTDIKIRSMVGKLFIVRKSLIPMCTCAIPVFRKIDVDEETKDFKEIYYKDFPLLRFFSTKRILRPLYYNMFDSWECPEKPKKDFETF